MSRLGAFLRALASIHEPRPPREVQYVTWATGDKLLRSGEGWRLAPEEDTNHNIGWVWLERDAPSEPRG